MAPAKNKMEVWIEAAEILASGHSIEQTLGRIGYSYGPEMRAWLAKELRKWVLFSIENDQDKKADPEPALLNAARDLIRVEYPQGRPGILAARLPSRVQAAWLALHRESIGEPLTAPRESE